MAIALSFQHIEGIRLRQQLAQNVERHEKDGAIIKGTEWHFETEPGIRTHAEIKQDLDPRTQKPTGRYSTTINYGLKNLVIERKGKVEHVQFRNSSVRNQLRIRVQTLESTGKKSKDGADIKEWRDSGTPQYLAPQLWGGVAAGDGLRAILDEMPT